MIPPVYEALSAAAAVTALVGTNPCRVYPAGKATQGVASPYVTWQIVTGIPENYLDEPPDIDRFRVQINAYAAEYDDCLALAAAVRDALEPHAHQLDVLADEQDPETKRYRYVTDWEFWTPRE